MAKEPAVAILSGTPEDQDFGFDSHCAELHVLAVDDSILDRKVIERLLHTSSYKVTTVDSGNKALEVLGIEGSCGSVCINISLIITDYSMPGMSGYDLLKRVKGTSALKEIPVVIMSSENIPNRIQRCLDEGAEEFIMKPVQMADVERLKEHIRTPSRTYCKNISGVSCSKRKLESRDDQEHGSERQQSSYSMSWGVRSPSIPK